MASAARVTRRRFLGTLSLGAAACGLRGGLAAKAADPAPASRPNIVVIMADDLGFSDIGGYGGEIATPNLDRLAAGGVRFSQFYNTARCCPSRASLLTGLYPHQAGVGHMVSDSGSDGYRGELNRRCRTLAEVLAPAGYATCMAGKWHVTGHTQADGARDNWPCQRGFQRFYGTLAGAGSYFSPTTLMEDNSPAPAPPADFYYTDAIGERAAGFVRDHHQARPGDPLFLYVAFTSPHWPLHAPEETIARYRGRYLRGWDAVRRERLQRQVATGLISPGWPLTPRDPAVAAWDDVPPERRAEMDLRMAVYAAMVDRLDQGVGRVLDSLRASGRLDNTLLLFLADNGGCAEGGPWGFERRAGGTLGTDSSFASYGQGWANASNTPFRLYKHWVHEGGIASPLIVHWPGRVPDPGTIRSQVGHIIDIMATCVDVSGARYPQESGGTAVLPLEGRSLVPAISGDPAVRAEALFWEHEGNRAVRLGHWKLVARHGDPWALYDMQTDRTEMDDRAAQHPEVVADLRRRYDEWATRCGVRPWPLAKAKPEAKAEAGGSAGELRTEFRLQPGDQLPRERAPQVGKRAFRVTAEFTAGPAEGVLVAQGGTRVGYALFVTGGRVALALRSGSGDQTPVVIRSPDPLPAGDVAVSATVATDGALALSVNGRPVAAGKAPSCLTDTPTEGLAVGADPDHAVGDYAVPNRFAGAIRGVTIVLTP